MVNIPNVHVASSSTVVPNNFPCHDETVVQSESLFSVSKTSLAELPAQYWLFR